MTERECLDKIMDLLIKEPDDMKIQIVNLIKKRNIELRSQYESVIESLSECV